MESKLIELADHNRVSGKVIDFSSLDPAHPIRQAYTAWDADLTNSDLANAVAQAAQTSFGVTPWKYSTSARRTSYPFHLFLYI